MEIVIETKKGVYSDCCTCLMRLKWKDIYNAGGVNSWPARVIL